VTALLMVDEKKDYHQQEFQCTGAYYPLELKLILISRDFKLDFVPLV
jgi:hypothetical protein